MSWHSIWPLLYNRDGHCGTWIAQCLVKSLGVVYFLRPAFLYLIYHSLCLQADLRLLPTTSNSMISDLLGGINAYYLYTQETLRSGYNH